MEFIFIILYLLPLLWIALYSFGQMQLVYLFLKYRKKAKERPLLELSGELPFVTIQLPIYNELYVVETLFEAISKFNYPKDRLEIQVLDDSNDETVELIAEKVSTLKAMGFNIEHIQRPNRIGFKAGALAYATEFAKGEYIAIFDADFQPKPDFLYKTLPYFSNPKIGLVQTRWEHINNTYSLLTQLQAFALDAHFSVEQLGRNMGGHFMNFNGTAGIWRKACIEDAGGWESDTLTEDLDLSYRAQLKGWDFVFVDSIATPSELPVALNAVKSQQFRWTKGAAECARKNLKRVLASTNISWITKLTAIFHLLNSSIFISILWMAVFSLPVLWVLIEYPQYNEFMNWASLFFLSFAVVAVFFGVSYWHLHGKKWSQVFKFSGTFLLFWALSMGFALHNSLAAIEGYIGKKTPFVRTPKFNIKANSKTWQKNKYLIEPLNPMAWVELFLCLCFLTAIILGIANGYWAMLPLHIALFVGYGGVSFYAFWHRFAR